MNDARLPGHGSAYPCNSYSVADKRRKYDGRTVTNEDIKAGRVKAIRWNETVSWRWHFVESQPRSRTIREAFSSRLSKESSEREVQRAAEKEKETEQTKADNLTPSKVHRARNGATEHLGLTSSTPSSFSSCPCGPFKDHSFAKSFSASHFFTRHADFWPRRNFRRNVRIRIPRSSTVCRLQRTFCRKETDNWNLDRGAHEPSDFSSAGRLKSFPLSFFQGS